MADSCSSHSSRYDRIRALLERYGQSRYSLALLFTLAFLESTFLIIPADLFIIALIPLSPYSPMKIAFYALLGSVAGGVAGYGLGFYAWQALAVPLLEELGVTFSFVAGNRDVLLPGYLAGLLGHASLLSAYKAWSGWLVALFAFTPLPYKLIAMASGAMGSSLAVFIAASLLGRSLRFFGVAWLVHRYHRRALDLIRASTTTFALILILIAGLWLVVHLWR